MFSSRNKKNVRKQRPLVRTRFGRRLILEPLEDRRLLSVTLGNPTASMWSYGQTESIAAMVTDNSTSKPPAVGTVVDLVNVSQTAGSANQILIQGATNDDKGDVLFDLTTLNVGSYNLMAEFTDSAGTLETSTPTVPVAVTQAATTTTLASSDPAPVYGEPLTITATVAPSVSGYGTPTGWVSFSIGNTPNLSILEKLNSSGVATLSIPGNTTPPTAAGTPLANSVQAAFWLQVGQNTIKANYLGDIDFAKSVATPLSLTVAQASTTTSLSSSANGVATVPYGQPVVFKATVQVVGLGTGIPGGYVDFVDTSTSPVTLLGKAPVTLTPKTTTANTGIASFVDSSLPVGTHTIVAYYLGNHDYLPSDSTPPETVTIGASASITMVWAAPNPAIYGAPVTLSAMVMPGYFSPVSGVILAAGSTVPVMPPVFKGLTGSVQFLDDNVDIGTPVPLVYGQAQLTVPSTVNSIPALPIGTDSITATYIPDSSSTFNGSTSQPYKEAILATPPVATTTTVTPKQQQITAGSEASFTITVSPTSVPGTDTVNVYDLSAANVPPGSATTLGTLLGTATYSSANLDWTFTTTTPLTGGSHLIEAAFSGDPNFLPSQGYATVVVVPSPTPIATTTVVTPKQQQITLGSEASFTITVSPATVPGSDTVTMYDVLPVANPVGGVTSQTLLGTATYSSTNLDWTFTTTTPLTAGSHLIEAMFSGDTNYAPSQGYATVLVTPPPPVATTTTVTPKQQQIAAGSEASFTITVSPAAVPGTDTVNMYDISGPSNSAAGSVPIVTFLGTAAYNSTNSDWTFTTSTPLPVGTQTIEASFTGDTNFLPSQGFASVQVLATPTTAT